MSSQHILTLLQSGLCWLNPAKIPELIGQIIFRKYISALLCPHRAKSKDSICDLHGEVLFSFELLKKQQLHFSLFSFVLASERNSTPTRVGYLTCVYPLNKPSYWSDTPATVRQIELSRLCFIKSVVYTENTKGIKDLRVHVRQTF